MRLLALILMCLPASLWGQEFAVRDGDERFDIAGLTDAVTGRTLVFYDDGVSKFSAGGAYSYTYSEVNGGGTQFGAFTVMADGIICILYRNGFDRCDMYVRSNNRLVVLTETGERYPVRPDPE